MRLRRVVPLARVGPGRRGPRRDVLVWVLTDYVDGQWTRLDQYLMPADLTCKGYCPLEPKKGHKARDSGIPGNCYSVDNPGN